MNSAAVHFINLDQMFTPSDDDLRCFWDLQTNGIYANHDPTAPRIRKFLRNSEHLSTWKINTGSFSDRRYKAGQDMLCSVPRMLLQSYAIIQG